MDTRAQGNHDHLGNCTAQIAYTARSSRWRLPTGYFEHTHTIPGTKSASVQFIMIDTVIWAGLSEEEELKRFPCVPDLEKEKAKMIAWVKKTLAESKATWIIVVG